MSPNKPEKGWDQCNNILADGSITGQESQLAWSSCSQNSEQLSYDCDYQFIVTVWVSRLILLAKTCDQAICVVLEWVWFWLVPCTPGLVYYVDTGCHIHHQCLHVITSGKATPCPHPSSVPIFNLGIVILMVLLWYFINNFYLQRKLRKKTNNPKDLAMDCMYLTWLIFGLSYVVLMTLLLCIQFNLMLCVNLRTMIIISEFEI